MHDVVLDSCRRHASKIAMVDASSIPVQRITYAAYGAMVERAARGLVAAGIRPGEVVGIFLPNCWEFGVAYHAATLAGAVPTTLNPTYRDREVRYQLENSDAVALISDGALLTGIDLSLLPLLRRVYTVRAPGPSGSQPFDSLFEAAESVHLPAPERDSRVTLATLPYSSGTTGLPKGVMLSHYNLVANVYQTLIPGEDGAVSGDDVMLCFLPLYHIYGLTVGLNLALIRGCTLVLMPRFDCESSLRLIADEGVTIVLCVPPTLLAYCQAAEQGKFPTRASPELGEVGCCAAGAGVGAPLHRQHRHSHSPGLRDDGSLAGHASWLPGDRSCTSRSRLACRWRDRLPRGG